MSRQSPVARVGDYHVLDFVGAGGMGEVFRAVHSRSGQVAAVKFLTGGADLSPTARARWRERFIHEARVQESLRHPNLAAFYEWHEVAGTPCIVMELVDGYTLTARIQQAPMPLPEAIAVFKSVVEGVAFMHSRGVIHRDIKSGNIKINGSGHIKLLDFGISKSDDTPRLTATGAFVGTLQYLSPEQVKGKPADARCDVWALGALFYEMLCGSPPFEAPTWGELLEKVAHAHYEPLGTRRSGVPREVEAIVRRCLQKQPAARFADAGELLLAITQLDVRVGVGTIAGANNASPRNFNPTSNTPYFVAGALGSFALLTWLLWPSAPTTHGNLPLTSLTTAPPAPLSNFAAIASPTGDTSSDFGSGATESKTITVDVFEGAAQTQIFRDNKLLGSPPYHLNGHVGEKVELSLSRPGFRTRNETITITPSRSVYSFDLDPLTP